MAFMTGLLLITVTAFVSLFITFKFFPKYKLGWKDKLWIALITVGVLMLIETIVYFFKNFVNSLNTNTRPAFGSVAFENFDNIVGEVVWFLMFPLTITFAVAGLLFQKSGMEQGEAFKIALVWGIVTAIVWVIILVAKSFFFVG